MRSDRPHILRLVTVFGLASAVVAITRRGDQEETISNSALLTYLHDHLSGADAAIQVVEHLGRTRQGTQEGALFASLADAFRADRAVLYRMVISLGHSPRSMKRLAGKSIGKLVKHTAGGDRGDLGLFRTLESLSIAVQGKRCLWRTGQKLGWATPGLHGFGELEKSAIQQWETIEHLRQSLVSSTFGSVFGSVSSPATKPKG